MGEDWRRRDWDMMIDDLRNCVGYEACIVFVLLK